MTLTEINAARQAARAKAEDLLSRTAAREMSTEENQMLTDLTAEGSRLAGLAKRYEMLASFDTPTTQTLITPPAEQEDKKAADSFKRWFRSSKMATDVPIQIVDSPVHGSVYMTPKTLLPGQENFPSLDTAVALGATIISVDNYRDVIYPLDIDATDADAGGETTRSSESKPYTSNHLTLSPTESTALIKVSQRSISDPAVDVVGKSLRVIQRRILRTASKAFSTAMEASVQGNSHCHVTAGDDIYESVSKLRLSRSQSYESDSNTFAASSATLQLIANVRADGSGEPLFDFSTKSLLDRRVVVVDELTTGYLYYGAWAEAAVQVRVQLGIQKLLELFALDGLTGFLGVAGFDAGFYSDLTSVTDQPVGYCHISANAGS